MRNFYFFRCFSGNLSSAAATTMMSSRLPYYKRFDCVSSWIVSHSNFFLVLILTFSTLSIYFKMRFCFWIFFYVLQSFGALTSRRMRFTLAFSFFDGLTYAASIIQMIEMMFTRL